MTNQLRGVVADALLPCPFCGLDVTDDEVCFPREVRCGNPSCFAHEATDETRETAIARWNRRATLQAQSAGVEERALGFQAAVALEVGADQDDQDDILLHVRAWVASAKGQAAAIRTPVVGDDLLDAVLDWWHAHMFDSYSCGDDAGEANVYDEPPEFVRIALAALQPGSTK